MFTLRVTSQGSAEARRREAQINSQIRALASESTDPSVMSDSIDSTGARISLTHADRLAILQEELKVVVPISLAPVAPVPTSLDVLVIGLKATFAETVLERNGKPIPMNKRITTDVEYLIVGYNELGPGKAGFYSPCVAPFRGKAIGFKAEIRAPAVVKRWELKKLEFPE